MLLAAWPWLGHALLWRSEVREGLSMTHVDDKGPPPEPPGALVLGSKPGGPTVQSWPFLQPPQRCFLQCQGRPRGWRLV